jgi:hypothetical protein
MATDQKAKASGTHQIKVAATGRGVTPAPDLLLDNCMTTAANPRPTPGTGTDFRTPAGPSAPQVKGYPLAVRDEEVADASTTKPKSASVAVGREVLRQGLPRLPFRATRFWFDVG